MGQPTVRSMTFPCGKGGLNRMDNYLNFPVEDLAWIDGITVENTAWEKEAGAIKLNSEAKSTDILTVRDFWYDDQVDAEERIYCLLDDKNILELDSAGATTTTMDMSLNITGTLTTATFLPGFTDATTFAPGFISTPTPGIFRTLILFTDAGLPVYMVPPAWNGTSDPNFFLTGYQAADWTSANGFPHFGFHHNFRVLAFTKTSSIIYMSNPKNHIQFDADSPNTYIMDVYPGEERYIAAGVSWRQTAYLFKYEYGIYVLNDTDSNIASWRVDKLTDSFGVAGHGCVLSYEKDVIVLSAEGYFYSLSDIVTLGQKDVVPILPQELGEFIRSEINTSRLDLVRSVYYARKRQIIFMLPATGTTVLNRRLVFDMAMPQRVRITWSERDTCLDLTVRRNSGVQQPMWCDADGFIWLGDQATRSKDSGAYTGQFETPPISPYPNGEQYFNLKEVQVTMKPTGNYDLSLEVHTDNTLRDTLTVSQQASGVPTGSFSLDADVLAGTVVKTTHFRINGEATRIKLLGRNTAAGETFAVQNITVRGTPGRVGI